jgi:uncharacterized membrane protein (DUF485 family)
MDTPPTVITEDPAAFTDLQRRGRTRLATLLGSWLIIALGIDTLYVAKYGSSRLPVFCVRFAITTGVFYGIWIGHNWARWLTLAVSTFATLAPAALLIINKKANAFFQPLSLFFLAIYLVFVLGLTCSKAITAFLSYQRSRRQSSTR